jgi:alanyl-tRNA synthetase
VTGAVRLLSVLPDELPQAIERAQTESKELRRSLKHLQEALATYEAARLVADAPLSGSTRLVTAALAGWDAAGLKAVASAATASPDVVVALFSTTTPIAAVLARSKNVTVDVQAAFSELVARFGGRGGGQQHLVQGGGFDATAETLVSTARDILRA